MLEKIKKKKKSMAEVEKNYNDERAMQQHEINERNFKMERILEEKRKNERRMEIQSIKHYRKRVKELKQGFPDPKTPPKLTEKEKFEKKLEEERKEEEALKNPPEISHRSPQTISPPTRKRVNKTFEEIQE